MQHESTRMITTNCKVEPPPTPSLTTESASKEPKDNASVAKTLKVEPNEQVDESEAANLLLDVARRPFVDEELYEMDDQGAIRPREDSSRIGLPMTIHTEDKEVQTDPEENMPNEGQKILDLFPEYSPAYITELLNWTRAQHNLQMMSTMNPLNPFYFGNYGMGPIPNFNSSIYMNPFNVPMLSDRPFNAVNPNIANVPSTSMHPSPSVSSFYDFCNRYNGSLGVPAPVSFNTPLLDVAHTSVQNLRPTPFEVPERSGGTFLQSVDNNNDIEEEDMIDVDTFSPIVIDPPVKTPQKTAAAPPALNITPRVSGISMIPANRSLSQRIDDDAPLSATGTPTPVEGRKRRSVAPKYFTFPPVSTPAPVVAPAKRRRTAKAAQAKKDAPVKSAGKKNAADKLHIDMRGQAPARNRRNQGNPRDRFSPSKF